MRSAFLADAVLVLHGLFIAWVLLGGLAVCWRAGLAWLHLPAVAWGVWVSWSGSYCPLTPLEQSLRRAAGQAGYEGGFVEHYLGRLIYPEGLTPALQWLFGAIVLGINVVLYAIAAHRVISRRDHEPQETPP
jgi:Protein of Unknown function (DUF2784)